MFFDRGEPSLRSVVAVDADYFQFAFITVVVSLHLRDSFDAPSAPAAPKVEHDILSAKRREGEILIVGGFQREVRSGAAGDDLRFGQPDQAVFSGFGQQRFEQWPKYRVAGRIGESFVVC